MNDMDAGAPALPGPADAGTPGATPAAAAGTVVPIPLDALAQPDEKDEMVNPEQGDIVDFQVEGKIVSINGGMAMVQPTAVNGKPLDGSDEPDEDDPAKRDEQGDQGFGQLEQMAQQQDQTQ